MNRHPVLAALATMAFATAAFAGAAEDSDIERKVADQLRRNPVVGHFGLAAKARDGKVTLEGRVRTLSESWDAEDAAGKVRGVLEIENRIAVLSAGAADETVAAGVKRRFEDLPAVAAAAPEVQVEQGVVTLSGKLRDARTRFAAIDAAAQVAGVMAVHDRLETPARDDGEIEKDVAGRLGDRSLVRVSGNVRSTVRGGIVTVSGWVTRAYDRKYVARLLLGTNGVRGVVDRLEVRPSKPDLVVPLD